MNTVEHLPPNLDKLDKALRSIGYSFEVAVADIVDNSIDAHAANVLVRIILNGNGTFDLAIWDDGKGMSDHALREAMRFGSDVSQEVKRLGKFGLGLKLASLSQAKEVHVISARNETISGRAWLETGIGRGFANDVHTPETCQQLVSALVPDMPFAPSATLVWWSGLYRIGNAHQQPEQLAQKLLDRLKNYLPLVFHRFLSGESGNTHLKLDIYDRNIRKPGIPIQPDPTDPFDYPQSGHAGFPAELLLGPPYGNKIKITAHIWPPNSDDPNYKLPGGTNARQGLYFYRNNRLIQGGGWNGIRETEPHSSLTRLKIDVADDFDMDVSLDVKKVEIQLPSDLVEAIRKSKTASGIDFKKYCAIGVDAYRKRTLTDAELPLIPSKGLPQDLITFLRRELRLERTKKSHNLKIVWTIMDKDTFFEIDRNTDTLHINRRYRKLLLHGTPGSSADLPVLKCLMFFALEAELMAERTGAKIKERLDRINKVLVKAVKHERLPK